MIDCRMSGKHDHYLTRPSMILSSSLPRPPTIDEVNEFLSLVTAASAPIAPTVAILGLSFFFVKWLSDAVLENV